MKILNKVGDSTPPCGTPVPIVNLSVPVSSLKAVRTSATYSGVEAGIMSFCASDRSLLISRSLGTLSQALFKSTNRMYPSLFCRRM